MAVKIHIKRKIKQSALKEVDAMLIRARKNAMVCKGYISTETLVDVNDPSRIMVVSMWQTVPHGGRTRRILKKYSMQQLNMKSIRWACDKQCCEML
jgi:hypothetical protein